MHDWRIYNERLVRRGKIFISSDIIKSWNKELAVMNHNKIGRRYRFPDSFMKILGYVKVYFGLPYRQTEGLVRTTILQYRQFQITLPSTRELTNLTSNKNQTNRNIVLVVDSSGIKLTNRGDWIAHKWQKRRDFSGYMSALTQKQSSSGSQNNR